MKFSLPYLLFLITCCYASVKTRGNMLDIKGSWKDAFDTGMCFQEATCEEKQNKQNFSCFGTELPYSSTSFVLAEDSRSLFEVEDNLVLWEGLRSVPRCWAVVQPLLCAVYMPKCENGSVFLPSQEMCRITRGPCKVVETTESWPSFLRCENKNLFPPRCKNPLQEIKFNTSYKCIRPLVETDNSEIWYDDVEGCGIQCQNPFYSSKEHEYTHNLIVYLASFAFMTTLLTVVTFLITSKSAKKHPAVSMYFINLCLVITCIGWLVPFFPGARDAIVCFPDGTLRQQQPKSDAVLCAVSFFLVYCPLMSAIIWFVCWTYALTIQFQNPGSAKDILKKRKAYFHIIAWCSPIVSFSCLLAFKQIDGDSMTGICFVGYNNTVTRSLFLVFISAATISAGYFLGCSLLTLIKRKKEEGNERNRKKYNRNIYRIGVFSVCAVFLIICTFACHVYYFLHQEEWKESLRDYIICLARKSGEMNLDVSHSMCSLKKKPNVNILHTHLLCMFAFTVLMSSWAWTKTSINTWKRFFNRCFGSKDKSPNIKKHELISKAFQKRYEFNRGRFSLSLNSNNEDPVGMNLENSSATSGLSSSWARSLPHFVSRRNAIAGIVPFVPRHYSSASDVSHHMSIDSYNQPNLDSASLQASEEYVLRHQRRKTKRERMRLWKTNRWFPRTRRDSDTSLQSSMISAAAVAAISAAQNQDVKISRATSTGDLGNQVLPMNLVPPTAVPPVFVRQASTRRTIPREEFKPHFTHGMTDNSHLLKQTNTASSQNTNQRFTPNPSSVNVCNVDQRFTPSSMMLGFSNPMNGLMPSAMYGQGFDYLNAMSYGYMGGMYPGMNGIYGAYPQNAINPNFNYAAFGVMPYASPYGTYPSNTEIVNSPSLIPMNPRVESASETEYFPIVMSDSEFTDTGHRSYDEVMTTQRLLQERAQAQALAAAQVEPVQHKTVLEPQACAKTEFLKRIGDSCTVKLKNCRPPSRQDRATAHSEVPPPSPADSLKSDEDYEDDDVFECFVNEENETSLDCNLNEQTEETNLFQKLKSSIQNALPSNNCQEPAETLEMDSLEHISLNAEAALASNTLKEECVNESERETLINAKDGNENVSR